MRQNLPSLPCFAFALVLGGLAGCAKAAAGSASSAPFAVEPRCAEPVPCPCSQAHAPASSIEAIATSDPGSAEPAGVRFDKFRLSMTGRALEDIARQLPQPSEGVPSARRPGGFAQKQLIRVGQTHLFSADVTDDGAYVLAVSDAEAQVRVYDARGALVSRFPVKGFTPFAGGSFAFYPGAGRPRVLAANEQGIALYDGLSGEWLSTLCDQPTWQMRLVLEKRLLIASLSDLRTQSSRLAFFEVLPEPGFVELGQLESQERIDGYDLSDDGRLLAMSTYPSNSVQLLNLSTPSLLWAVEGPKYVRPIDISPDGRLVAAGGDLLVVYDAQDASRRAELKGYGNNLHEIRFLDRDGELATTSYDGAIRLVSVDKEKPALRLVQTLRHGGKANVYAIVVRNGGDEILTSSGDKTIRRFSRKAR